MHPKRRDNHDRYLRAIQVKALVKKTADKKGISEEQARQHLLKGYRERVNAMSSRVRVKQMDSKEMREVGNQIITGIMNGINAVQRRKDFNDKA
ncbi:TPA: hypothetical protein ROY30_005190 [Bacillus cereus]|uniref:hypothetical protein n=1 Tax=Bacillus sp. 1663tsa1 TaxID=2953804 RepID=UPI0020A088C0|nr:hypothetical protein [Bacillus sp. 1663tsa1]MCP1181304.1 hypothetical protein [Bacillus sp. 1663tsa1]MCU5751608.1 hypothetical protein [Bacillus cereus]HDX9631439.1 hypothetical protein [Bacillus cereus]